MCNSSFDRSNLHVTINSCYVFIYIIFMLYIFYCPPSSHGGRTVRVPFSGFRFLASHLKPSIQFGDYTGCGCQKNRLRQGDTLRSQFPWYALNLGMRRRKTGHFLFFIFVFTYSPSPLCQAIRKNEKYKNFYWQNFFIMV